MTVTIRAAEARDLAAVSVLAGMLVRQHHEYDVLRFMLIPDVLAGYARFFKSQLREPSALILVAERDSEIVGYAYARMEPRDWNNLLDACGELHDIFISDSARRQGVARLLVDAVRDRLREKGAPRLVLHTASKNATARHFFASVGFRETMIELTQEL
jgi:ribosomal protein S18 acetylase RimI-like enzyme